MGGLFELDALTGRLRRYVELQGSLRPESAGILEEVLLRGEMAQAVDILLPRLFPET